MNDSKPKQPLDSYVKLEIIALDPGARTFLTGFSPDGMVTEFAPGDVKRLCKLGHVIDKVSSRLTSPTVRHKERQRLKRIRLRTYSRISNLVSEVHWKSADYLCRHYAVILLPTFGTQKMVNKRAKRRVINNDTARRLLMWSHYKFRQRLLHKG